LHSTSQAAGSCNGSSIDKPSILTLMSLLLLSLVAAIMLTAWLHLAEAANSCCGLLLG
jgi:hypothetical protein